MENIVFIDFSCPKLQQNQSSTFGPETERHEMFFFFENTGISLDLNYYIFVNVYQFQTVGFLRIIV